MKMIFGQSYGQKYMVDLVDVEKVHKVESSLDTDDDIKYICVDEDIDFEVVADKRVLWPNKPALLSVKEEIDA